MTDVIIFLGCALTSSFICRIFARDGVVSWLCSGLLTSALFFVLNYFLIGYLDPMILVSLPIVFGLGFAVSLAVSKVLLKQKP